MSASGPTEDTRPLTEREFRQVQRLFSDPFSFPIAFKAWLTSFVETSDMRLPQASVHSLPDTVIVASDSVPKQIFDAKGDLIVGTADNTYERLPAGADGQELVADSAVSRGVKWATPRTVATDPLFDAKGDLAAGTGPDAAARLPVGSDGQVLTADAAQTTGLKWAAPLLALNTQTASYVLALSDAGKLVRMNVGSANTLTIPTNASVAFPIGTRIEISQVGTGLTSIVAAGGVTLNSRGALVALNGQFAWASLVKVATNTWQLFGDLA